MPTEGSTRNPVVLLAGAALTVQVTPLSVETTTAALPPQLRFGT